MSKEQRLEIQKNAVERARDFSIEKLMQQLHEYLLFLKGREE